MWASLVAAFIIVTTLSGRMATGVANTLAPLLGSLGSTELTPESLAALLAGLALAVAKVLAWPFAVVIVITVTAMVIQTKGFMWIPSKLAPDFARISPLAGIKRLFSPQQLIELVKQLAKIGVIGTTMVLLIRPRIREYQSLAELDLLGILAYLRDRIFALMLAVVLFSTLLMVSDFILQRFRFMEKMKMSKQEVRDENKQQEGDPMVKGRIRSLRMKRARQRMMQAVPGADVVVTNPTHYAVALKYDMDTMGAPVLVAKGTELVAKRIRDLASENEVPIVENPPLARALYATVELDEEIPPEHYKAVAEVIGYVMRLKGELGL